MIDAASWASPYNKGIMLPKVLGRDLRSWFVLTYVLQLLAGACLQRSGLHANSPGCSAWGMRLLRCKLA